MIDHIGVRVQDFDRAVAFYKAALAPIGYSVLMEFPGTVGMGEPGKPDLWLMQAEIPPAPTHVALTGTRDAINQFFAAALAAGGTDNGPPGLRVDYHPSYYAAFVRDPEGNNIEIVCHTPPGMPKVPAAKKAKAKARRAPKAKPKAKAMAKKKPAPKAKAKKKAKRR